MVYLEIADDEVLEREIVVSFVDDVFSVHLHLVRFRVVGNLHRSLPTRSDFVSCARIHYYEKLGLRRYGHPEVDGEYGRTVLFLFDAFMEPLHELRDGVGFCLLLGFPTGVAESEECVFFNGLSVV